jgi:multiple sugar transport system ATP-binding protein
VSARSKVRPNQPVELAIDTDNLQFFDADSGLSIGHPEAHPAAAEPLAV